ncbi:DUF1906 domain-containing protein [Kitasatospora sp. NBC_00315]|uniref:DUF1906 domain-containing protein n=1 Tax=Kitasatospora sp. NBC_00315 TaxID=2975963 RepID=UPI00324D14EA
MRYLRPASLAAASLVLLLATDGGAGTEAQALSAAASAAGAPGSRAAAPRAATPLAPRIRRTVLRDSAWSPTGRSGEVFTGAGFDVCTAPALDTMKTWRASSPYGVIGVYTSGSQRGCAQPRLTADWVRQARAMGWRFLPTHVGLQAPCRTLSGKPQHIDPANAVQQGRDEAAVAVRGLKAVGLGKGSPVYLDIESYPRQDAACGQAVVDFTLGWTQALHAAGYRSGFYSSLDSGVADLAAAARAGSSPLPDALWYAQWDDHPTTDTAAPGGPGAELWAGHQRVHQYRGNVEETYGGASLTIDRDQLDAPVAA